MLDLRGVKIGFNSKEAKDLNRENRVYKNEKATKYFHTLRLF